MENGILMECDCMHKTKIEVGCAWPSQYEGYLGITQRELDQANMKATWESLLRELDQANMKATWESLKENLTKPIWRLPGNHSKRTWPSQYKGYLGITLRTWPSQYEGYLGITQREQENHYSR